MENIPKNQIKSRNVIEQREHEDNAAARRVTLVDGLGVLRDANNPLPVKIQDAEININGEFGVKLTDKDNDPDPGNVADAVQVGDGTYRLKVNADGSINVVAQQTALGTAKNVYNAVTSVPAGIATTVATYTVPALTTAILELISASGDNIAVYTIKVNGSPIDTRRTYFGGDLNTQFEFISKNSQGLSLIAGDVVTLETLHNRPFLGKFEGRIQVVEFV